MSDKAVAMIVTTLIAAPLAVVCCAAGPAAFLAFASGTITGTKSALIGDISLPNTIMLAAAIAFISFIFWSWWQKKRMNTRAELEDTYEGQ